MFTKGTIGRNCHPLANYSDHQFAKTHKELVVLTHIYVATLWKPIKHFKISTAVKQEKR